MKWSRGATSGTALADIVGVQFEIAEIDEVSTKGQTVGSYR